MNSIRTIAIVVFMACYLSACGGRSTPSPPAPPPPVTKTTVLSTVGSVSSAAKGNSVEFIATDEFSDRTMQDVTASATWSSDDTAVLAFNVNGLPNLAWVTGVGKATVSATISGAAVGTSLEIDGTPATLKTLHVEPSVIPAGVPIGERGQFEAGGVYSDETIQILTKSVWWSSSDGTKASISNDPGTEGQAVALQAGQATITAELDGKTSVAVGVTIVSSSPKEIVLEPTTAPVLLLGRTFPYRAYVVYENNDVDEVTIAAAPQGFAAVSIRPWLRQRERISYPSSRVRDDQTAGASLSSAIILRAGAN